MAVEARGDDGEVKLLLAALAQDEDVAFSDNEELKAGVPGGVFEGPKSSRRKQKEPTDH